MRNGGSYTVGQDEPASQDTTTEAAQAASIVSDVDPPDPSPTTDEPAKPAKAGFFNSAASGKPKE